MVQATSATGRATNLSPIKISHFPKCVDRICSISTAVSKVAKYRIVTGEKSRPCDPSQGMAYTGLFKVSPAALEQTIEFIDK